MEMRELAQMVAKTPPESLITATQLITEAQTDDVVRILSKVASREDHEKAKEIYSNSMTIISFLVALNFVQIKKPINNAEVTDGTAQESK